MWNYYIILVYEVIIWVIDTVDTGILSNQYRIELRSSGIAHPKLTNSQNASLKGEFILVPVPRLEWPIKSTTSHDFIVLIGQFPFGCNCIGFKQPVR